VPVSGVIIITRDYAVTDLVQELIRFLSQDPLAVSDIAARVGPVEHDPGIPMTIELQPALPGVRSAHLTRYPDSGLPYVLTIEPEPDARPTPAMLKGALGDYRRMLTHFDLPPELIFYPPAEGTHWRVAVIVKLKSDGGDFETAPIISIALRRDPVSP
jgi:hypothetical protein